MRSLLFLLAFFLAPVFFSNSAGAVSNPPVDFNEIVQPLYSFKIGSLTSDEIVTRDNFFSYMSMCPDSEILYQWFEDGTLISYVTFGNSNNISLAFSRSTNKLVINPTTGEIRVNTSQPQAVFNASVVCSFNTNVVSNNRRVGLWNGYQRLFYVGPNVEVDYPAGYDGVLLPDGFYNPPAPDPGGDPEGGSLLTPGQWWGVGVSGLAFAWVYWLLYSSFKPRR